MRAVLLLSSLLLALGCQDELGACVIGADARSDGICAVNYRDDTCAAMKGTFTPGRGPKARSVCEGMGYVEPVGSAAPTTPAELDRRVVAGELVSLGRRDASLPPRAPSP